MKRDNKVERKRSRMNCPVCEVPLVLSVGDQVHPGNVDYGVTLDCGNRGCPSTVSAHGKNEKEAFEVLQEKCAFGMKKGS